MNFKIVIVALLAFAVQAEAAKPEWAGKGKKHQSEPASESAEKKADKAFARFTSTERQVITDYYRDAYGLSDKKYKAKKQKQLPPGLKKKLERGGTLPPGWQMKLHRGEVLDAELSGYTERLPEALRERLNQDTVTKIIRLKDKIIRVGKGDGTIHDILDLTEILTGISN